MATSPPRRVGGRPGRRCSSRQGSARHNCPESLCARACLFLPANDGDQLGRPPAGLCRPSLACLALVSTGPWSLLALAPNPFRRVRPAGRAGRTVGRTISASLAAAIRPGGDFRSNPPAPLCSFAPGGTHRRPVGIQPTETPQPHFANNHSNACRNLTLGGSGVFGSAFLTNLGAARRSAPARPHQSARYRPRPVTKPPKRKRNRRTLSNLC